MARSLTKNYAASNHNIPEAARRILAALHYYELEPVDAGPADKGFGPSPRFRTFRSGDVEISIAAAAQNKPITVTIAKVLPDGIREEMLFHFDPVQKILLSAMQTEAH